MGGVLKNETAPSNTTMAKKITANLKLRIPAGKASAGPPVGSTLGQYGVKMMDFVNPGTVCGNDHLYAMAC